MKLLILKILVSIILQVKSQNETNGFYKINPNSWKFEEDDLIYRKWRSDSLDGSVIYEKPSDILLDYGVVYEDDGERRPTDIVLGHFSRLNNSYFILAPTIARPSTVYRLLVYPYQTEADEEQIDVTATMAAMEGQEIAFAEVKALPGEATPMLLQLPDTLPEPYLRLRIEGRKETGLVFVNSTLIYPKKDFLSIMVQMARTVFNGDQQVEFRVILLKMDMVPYQEPIDVFVLDSAGYIVRRWLSRVPNAGVVDLDFVTPNLPAGGFWRVRVRAGSQIKEQPFLVVKFYVPRFELYFGLDPYVVVSDGTIEVEISSACTNDAPIYGNMTVEIYVKYPWGDSDSQYKYISRETVDYFAGEETLAISMGLFDTHVPELNGCEVKFVATLMDRFTGISFSGFVKTRLIEGGVKVNFVDSATIFFRPGMPITLTVGVSYEDENPIDSELLHESSLRINSVATLQNGGSRQLERIVIPRANEDDWSLRDFFSFESYLDNQFTLSENSSYTPIDEGGDAYFSFLKFQSKEAQESIVSDKEHEAYRESGILSFTLTLPDDAISLTVSASYEDSNGNTAAATLDSKMNFSPKNRQLRITTSTEQGMVGEFAIFHIRSNFLMDKFHYLIMAKGVMIHSSTEHVDQAGIENVVTLSIAVSREMYPVFTIVAYYVDHLGNIAVDSITMPVQAYQSFYANVQLNQHKDHSKASVEGTFDAEPGTWIYMHSSRAANFEYKPRGRFTEASVLRAALNLEPFPMTISKTVRVPRSGSDPEKIRIYGGNDLGGEGHRTLQLAGLLPVTDSRFDVSTPNFGRCEISLGYMDCNDGTCYRYDQVCDGIYDCPDGYDELMCQYEQLPIDSHEQGVTEKEIYLLLRMTWWKDLYDTEDGSFAWYNKFIAYRRKDVALFEVPATQDDWIIDIFAVHTELGYIKLPSLEYNTNPPVFIVLDAPPFCRRGEQVSIRTAVFNSLEYEMMVMLILPESDDYRFIHVEANGRVEGFNPRTSGGEHHHIVFLKAEETKEVFIPLAVLLQKGTLEVTVKMVTQLAQYEETVEIEVRPEGAPVRKHTSVLLDLKTRALFYEFIDIPIDESPIITNRLERRFIYGSPEAQLTLSGDVFGPIAEGISVGFQDSFNGRWFKSTDGLAFNFGATLWSLHYLRLTNQLILAESLDAFDFLNRQMAGIYTRIEDGGYKMWHYSESSVWLTIWVTNLLQHALLEDWENYIYVDPRILNDGAQYIIDHQEPEGYFIETGFFNATLDSKHRPLFEYNGRQISISLTAFAVYTLQEVLPALPGRTRPLAVNSVWHGRKFLERILNTLKDPYDIAITSWALTVIGSPEKDSAVEMLFDHIRSKDGFLYWAKKDVLSNVRNFENNQRNFILPREPQEWDSHAIETTSYALLTLLTMEGVTLREEKIVNWLITVRDFDFAFAATVDSVIAFRALTEYCFRARVRDVTDLGVEIQSSSSVNYTEFMSVQNPFVSVIQTLEIPNPWGHLFITGRGSGQAIAQATIKWGVDDPIFLEKPPRKYFDITLWENHHPARNKSRITTTVCAKWTATDLSPTSTAAMIEVELPSGYLLYQPEANEVVKVTKNQNKFPEMYDCLVTDTYIYFQFSKIPSYEQCFQYDIHRWYQVANLTFTRSAMVFELFAPEHFEQKILNSTTLAALDICEVCGSYQCPYCQFYSDATFNHVNVFYLVILTFISVLYSKLDIDYQYVYK